MGLIQSQASADCDANLQHALASIENAAKQGARIVCLPELFRTRYFPQVESAKNFDLAEPTNGPSVTACSSLAAHLQITILVPIFEKRAPGLYHNSVVSIGPSGDTIGHYRKMHVPDDPHFYEKYYFAPGDLGVTSVEHPVPIDSDANDEKFLDTRHSSLVTFSTLVCWDQWYPEAARMAALSGAQMIFYPTAIGWHESEPDDVREEQLDAWITIQRSHAIANGVFVVAVNRVGKEDELTFWGSSFACNPAGKVIAQASRDREEVLVVECDLHSIEEQRRGWPFLRDRRIDAYADIVKRFIE